MTTFTADQLRSIITLSQDRYHECRTRDGLEAESTRRYAALNRTAATMLHEATNSGYEYLNTEKRVKLSDLVVSDDISDKTIIQVFGINGNFLARGHWYEDDILEWTQAVGTAKIAGSNPDYKTVFFRIAEPENSSRVSVDGGATWISPVEALSFVRLGSMLESMDSATVEAVERDAAPRSELEFLTAYLQKAPTDLVLG